MNNTKRTIIIAVAIVICAVAVVFGGIFGASRIIHRDEVEAIKAEKENENISTSAQEENTSQYVVIPNAPDGSVQYGGEELFNDKAKNNVLTPENANNNGSAGTKQGSASQNSGSENGGSSNGSSDSGQSSSGGGNQAGAPYALSSNDKSAVLNYYKKVSNINANLLFHKSLKLVSMNGGETVKESWVNTFRGMAEKGLAKNNIDDEPYPGKPNQIMASDWQSA